MVVFSTIALILGLIIGIEIERRFKLSESEAYRQILTQLGQNMQKIGREIEQENQIKGKSDITSNSNQTSNQ